jgi:hypothetical protein
MNEHELDGLGERLGEDALAEEEGIAPIDVIDLGANTPEAATELAKLLLADPAKALIKAGTVASLYLAVQKLERPNADVDERNNLGCAWALLAYNEGRSDYWPRALDALDASEGIATTDEQKRRVKVNREYVVDARRASEG